MPKVFFLGCNHDQVPYLIAAKKLGFIVIGTDRNPEAPGAPLCDEFYPTGYTDINKLKEIADTVGWSEEDKVFTAAAHFAYEGAANLAERMSLKFLSKKSVDICLDKTKFYSILDKHGIPVPPTRLYKEKVSTSLDNNKIYYLKSDYGKSPNYCYRITDGNIPVLPMGKDAFYRHNFVIQEEIKGVHYRLNLYADQAAVFMKFSDVSSVPIYAMGPGHAIMVGKLKKMLNVLGAENMLAKFDLIVNERKWYVIDIGLDPPMRLNLLCQHLGFDLPYAYTRYYLLNDPDALPCWDDICKPVVIKGTPQQGIEFIHVG